MPTASFKVREMLHKRTLNSKTWMNFDGSYTTEIHPGTVHFVDEHGNLQNINTDLYDEADFDVIDQPVAAEGVERFKQTRKETQAAKKNNVLNRSQHNFQALRVPFDAHIPRNFQRGYTIGKGVDKLTFKPVKSSPSTGELSQTDRSVIVYQDVWNDTDVELKIQPDGIKETLYLKTDKAPSSFSFEVKGKEIAADFTAGALKLMPAWLIDAAGTYRDVEQKVVQGNDNKVYVELIAPVDGLVYPIEIDPTVVIQPDGAAGKDSAILKSSPNTVINELVVGNYDSDVNRTYRGLIEFPLTNVPSGSKVINAEMTIILEQGGYLAINIGAHQILNSWSESTVTWNTQPSFNSTAESTVLVDNTTNKAHTWNITSIADKWVNQVTPNYGLMLYSPQEAQAFSSKQFEYSEDITADQRPKLTVTYNVPPTVPNLTTPNGGESWNAEHTVIWQASTDVEGNAIVYEGQLSTDNGATWKTIFSNVSGESKIFDFINEKETSTALLRIRAYDGYSYSTWDTSNGVFTIQHNQAPSAPTNLIPAAGVLDRTKVTRLAWKHNDPNTDDYQSKAEIQWRVQGATTWNAISVTGINQYIDMNSGVFPANSVEWRVRTYDQNGLPSPYSETKVFVAADPSDAPTIVQPESSVAVARPIIEWVSSDQIAYQIILTDSLNQPVWDTGEVLSAVKARTIEPNLMNGGFYKIKVRVKNAAGLFTSYAEKAFTVSYTPPAKPFVATKGIESKIILTIDNTMPIGTEPSVIHHEIYRRSKTRNSWIRIATEVMETFIDYSPASGEVYEYFARAWGANGTFSDSNFSSSEIKIRSVWLHDPLDPSSVSHFPYFEPGRSRERVIQGQLMEFEGRQFPMAEFSSREQNKVNVVLQIKKDSTGLQDLHDLVSRRTTLLYRDAKGRRMFGVVFVLPENETDWGYNVPLEILQVGFEEEV